MTDQPIISIDSIDQYNKMYGFETFHPMVSVVDIADAAPDHRPNHITLRYGLYALWLKNGIQCALHYGRRKYDYQEGTIVSFAPGQVVRVDMTEEQRQSKAHTVGLLFSPDLIYGTPLGKSISSYHFFDYDSAESLHLSERERQMVTDTLRSIRFEMEQPVDKHSQTILTDRIKLILDYCQRFYDRSSSHAIRRTPTFSRLSSRTSRPTSNRARPCATDCPQWPISPTRPACRPATLATSSARRRG